MTTAAWSEDTDFGDDSANASAITADGSTITGVLGESDEDWFTYVPTANTKVQFDFRNIDHNWKYMYIYQDTGMIDLIQATSTNAYYGDSSLTCFFDTSGPVYIKIKDGQGGYTITATESTTHTPDGFANTHDVAEIIIVDNPATIGTISDWSCPRKLVHV